MGVFNGSLIRNILLCGLNFKYITVFENNDQLLRIVFENINGTVYYDIRVATKNPALCQSIIYKLAEVYDGIFQNLFNSTQADTQIEQKHVYNKETTKYDTLQNLTNSVYYMTQAIEFTICRIKKDDLVKYLLHLIFFCNMSTLRTGLFVDLA